MRGFYYMALENKYYNNNNCKVELIKGDHKGKSKVPYYFLKIYIPDELDDDIWRYWYSYIHFDFTVDITGLKMLARVDGRSRPDVVTGIIREVHSYVLPEDDLFNVSHSDWDKNYCGLASSASHIGDGEGLIQGIYAFAGFIVVQPSGKQYRYYDKYIIGSTSIHDTGDNDEYLTDYGVGPTTLGLWPYEKTLYIKGSNFQLRELTSDDKYFDFYYGKVVDLDNPYDGGDDPGDDDNKPGDYDHTSDPVPEPDLPTVSVTDSGLVTLFAPTESQLKSLANYLWSDAFSLDSFKKMLNNPMDCILGLSIVPVNVPRGSAREITVGNIVTTVSCDICPTQYVKVDCGTFTFDRHKMTNSYLDYSPYSKCYLYLPFIGVQEINIDDFMQSTMHVVYHVDILTGAMFCYVMRDSNVMYTYMGQCAENVPLSSSSYSNTIGSIMSAAASIVGVASMAATGGATAPVAAGLLAGATTSTANAVSSLKPSVAHSGSIGGGAGIMGVNYPYLIFNTPHVSIPSQQRHYTGYPSNQIVKLSALKGFNVIQAINLSVSGANDAEMNEIENILKGGVIL